MAVIPFAFPGLLERAEGRVRINTADLVLFFVGLVVLFDLYSVYQQYLIKRLHHQLAEKQGHSDVLRNLAMIDPLTGLYNRCFAEQRLATEVARSEHKGHPLTVLTLDLNSFKETNDKYGQRAGDQVLQEFATRLNRVIRGSDLAVRLGGDEFLVLLPECTVEQLQLVLGRLGVLKVDRQGEKILSPSRQDGSNMNWENDRRKCRPAPTKSYMPKSERARSAGALTDRGGLATIPAS